MTFDEFEPYVLPYAKNCPSAVVAHHVKLAAVTFCGRTLAWQEELTPVTTAAGVDLYTMNLPAGSQMVRLLRCNVGDYAYEAITAMQSFGVTKQYGGAGRRTYSRVAWSINRQDIKLYPAPDGLGLLGALVALKPDITTATEIPDDLSQYVQDIAEGAIESLLMMPKDSPWSDPNTAVIHGAKFNDRIGTVAALVAKGFGDAQALPGRRLFY